MIDEKPWGVGSGEWYHAVRTESAACAVRYHSPPPTQLRQFPDRQLPDPSPGEGEDGVAHGGGDRRDAGLAGAPLGIGARPDVNLDDGRFGHPDHAVGIEVPLHHPAPPHGYPALQGPPEPANDPAP